MRATLVVGLVVTLVLGASPARAAEEDLDGARRDANAAAAELAGAQSRLAELEVDIVDAESRAAENKAQMDALEGLLREQAVEQYIQGGQTSMPVMLEADLSRAARADALARFVVAGNDDAVDQYRSARTDLAAAEEELADKRDEMSDAFADLEDRVEATNTELARLEKLEAERTAREEAERREREARAADQARAAEQARQSEPRQSTPTTSGGGGSSGRSSGPARVVGNGSWMCPVQGPRAFSNDWGQPRSGGRRHQGNDIFSPRGTPVVASVAGSVRSSNSVLGGISYYLSGEDGNTYYGAHLDSLAGVSGRVSQGTVVGYVGDSGNARGGATHLHFEVHPGGGAAINPYPTLSQYC